MSVKSLMKVVIARESVSLDVQFIHSSERTQFRPYFSLRIPFHPSLFLAIDLMATPALDVITKFSLSLSPFSPISLFSLSSLFCVSDNRIRSDIEFVVQQQEDDDEMQIPHPDDDFDAPVVDDRPSFTWAVENSKIPNEYMVSDIFNVAGYKWQIFIFPKGNNIPSHLSIYLDVVHPQTLPYGWRRGVHLGFTVVDQNNRESSFRKETQHQFNARESVWGFTDFMLVDKLHDPSSGFLIDDFFIVEVDVKVLDYWSHDSKKETGYVGLKNQGVTCYMNSLLQMLYNIPYFRKAVYHMPITENDVPFRSIPLALQTIFYSLQYSDISVPTEQLTVSFGLDLHSFVKHDVQEFSRFLCEKLEEIMKGTVVEGTIQQLFEGYFVTNIECINVDYKSTSKQSFYDLQLDVKGCRDVYASFDKYVEVEYLDYKYDTEDYGLQDVRKGYLFIDFPPVLQLQLNRFEYDFVQGTMVKCDGPSKYV
ncbi:ubiquitin carboxyl-terminal hydrolase 12-like isoform X1 [Senna tora]|uniref:Ubiquitin carboxyl-terminal hydrolase 12-like isoform X1 n=1 Tax=Senna tora TaxID=362788 RepID=A0A834T7S9_9FABA|nr:ubiquitin carboxyl-terminal hydrolase 12-like isoform X1 [Senna tora]